ncbi:hypothetical protein AOG28_08450 [Cobetia sp. UCD-24C]|nr:hypothetical protein AOG28_08450 [Cobetia sp. UCD-24C]
MRAFFEGPDGQDILTAEREMLSPLFERCFGFHSLNLGPGGNDLLSLSAIRHAIQWSPEAALAESPSTLICPLTQLALPDESMDLVMLHHLLEVAPEPHRLLREAARVLRSSGCLVIVAWQPLSGEGLLRLDPRRRRITPWEGSWRTPAALRDWLAFVDFEIERIDYAGFHLPGLRLRHGWLERMGRRYNLPLGSLMLIRARRNVGYVQPLNAKRPRVAIPGVSIGQATRVHSREGHVKRESHRDLSERG